MEERFSSGEHRKIGMYGGTLYVCGTCTNVLGFNIRWDRAHPERVEDDPLMNAAETIQAAIDKLERQRDAAPSKGEWVRNDNTPVIGTASGEWVVRDDCMYFADANLVVTLHRTIDAQLAILRFGLRHNIVLNEALELARAILGGDS